MRVPRALPKIARLDLDAFGWLAGDDARPQPQVGNEDVARRLAQSRLRWVARVRPHGVLDDVGAAHPVDIGNVGQFADAGEQRRQVVEPLRDDVDDLALARDLAAASWRGPPASQVPTAS